MGIYNDQRPNGNQSAPMYQFQDNPASDAQAHDAGIQFDEEVFRQSPDSIDLLNRLGLMPDAHLALSAFENSAFNNFRDEDDEESNEDGKGLMLADTRFSSPLFHLAPRLQSLLNYYDANICPYLVTFDGAENPYRRHVLQLATQNTGLQHALAALSLNNHRMRRAAGQRPQIGFVEEITTGEPTPEETKYKQLSIDELNMQLTDARAAQDDGVLATLLILCLFHVCDSGFSKFRTQLAGVQKLLSLRRRARDDFTSWVEMFFTWFDVMTSTVNDRETQIGGDSLAMLDYSTNLGALEQFSGCDGRLFKLIARLGRLNLLAQGRPVKEHIGGGETPISQTHQPSSTLQPNRKRKFRAPKSLSPLDYQNIDGNGWGTPILSSDEEDAPGDPDSRAPSPGPQQHNGHHNSSIPPDSRHAFWTEYHALRSHLTTWQMPPPSSPLEPPTTTTTNNPPSASQDLLHINESFRYSALLYTTRLGSPLLPSSHPSFQTLVSSALYHITSLPTSSCVNKFLLWPLFITGTECTAPSHREIIRSRCRDLTDESGFFNNMSSLAVLERVWAERSGVGSGGEAEEVRARRRDSRTLGVEGGVGQAFRWRRAMDRVEGEYIVL